MAPKITLTSEQIDAVEEALRTVGFYIMENVLTPAEADAARASTLALAENDIARDHHPVYGDAKIRRVWALASKGPLFRQLIQHPKIIAIWQRVLGEDVISSSFTANIVGPKAPEGGWHVDYPYWAMQAPFPDGFICGQTVWMLDDFTAENGATVCIAGSHRNLRPPLPEELENQQLSIAAAPKGSVLFTNGAIWHQCLPNQTDRARVGLLAMYNRSVIYPQEDMPRQLTDAELQGESDLLKQLLGRKLQYRDDDHGLNWQRTATGFEQYSPTPRRRQWPWTRG